MRIIKFRAWDKTNKEMYYQENGDEGVEFFFGGKNEVRICYYKPDLINGECIDNYDYDKLEDYELMQFTGLLDKNGKEIYEGDIVRSIEERGDDIGNFTETLEQEVIFDGCAFYPVCTAPSENWEVIGNIYETPTKD